MKVKTTRTNHKSVSRFKNEAEKSKHIDHLTYEYLSRNEKIRKTGEELHSYDNKTGQKLFQPKVVPYIPIDREAAPNFVHHTNKKDVFDDILKRDADALDRKKIQELRQLEREYEFMKKSKACALSHSVQILRESTDKQIKSIFDSLLDCTSTSINHPESEAKTDGKSGDKLDIMQIGADMLASDVFLVVHEGWCILYIILFLYGAYILVFYCCIARNSKLRALNRRPISVPTNKDANTVKGLEYYTGKSKNTSAVAEEPLWVDLAEFNLMV